MTTSLSGSFTGTVCRKSALAMVKIMVLAPVPSVRESTASSVKPGRFISIRQPYFKSCRNTLIDPPAVHLQKFRSRLIIGNLRAAPAVIAHSVAPSLPLDLPCAVAENLTAHSRCKSLSQASCCHHLPEATPDSSGTGNAINFGGVSIPCSASISALFLLGRYSPFQPRMRGSCRTFIRSSKLPPATGTLNRQSSHSLRSLRVSAQTPPEAC